MTPNIWDNVLFGFNQLAPTDLKLMTPGGSIKNWGKKKKLRLPQNHYNIVISLQLIKINLKKDIFKD